MNTLMRVSLAQFCLLKIALTSATTYASNHNEEDLFTLPLADLAQMPIITASRTEDSQFNAPIAISSLNRAEINRSNVTSIPEALRLIPGVVVKEETRGNYDIYIRGLDSVPPGNAPVFSTNSSTLVMIDYQPVYNWFTGGIYWSSLGISLEDVDRIEVVRGPASAMYGPNAANGVIHIITRKPTKDGWNHVASVTAGEDNYLETRWRSDYKSKTFDLSFFAKDNNRDRTTNLYYGFQDQQYLTADELELLGGGTRYLDVFIDALPDQDSSLEDQSWGLSTVIHWQDNVTTHIDYRDYDSEFHDTIIENGTTPLSFINYEGQYFSLSQQWGNFKFSYSRDESTQDLAGSPTLDFDSEVEYFQLEAKYTLEKLNIHGLVSHASGEIDSIVLLGSNNEKELKTSSAAIHMDYQLSDKLRAIAAYRHEEINTDQNTENSYQLGLTYQANNSNHLWVMHGKAFRSPFILDTYTELETVPVNNIVARFSGSEQLDLLSIEETQLGWRTQLNKQLSFQTELFYRDIDNFSSFVATGATIEGPLLVANFNWINLPTSTEQTGITFEANWKPHDQIQIKAHTTWQRTELDNRQNVAGVSDLFNETYDGSPELTSGLNLYWQLTKHMLLSIESYYLSEHTPEYGYGFTVSGIVPQNVSEDIDSKFTLDLGLNIQISQQLQLKISGKNLADQDDNEFLYADPTPRYIVGQLKYDF